MFTIGLQLYWILTPTQNFQKFMNDKNNKLQNKLSSFLTRHCYYSIFCKDTAIRLYTNHKSFTQHLYETSLAKTSIHRTYEISSSWSSFLNKYYGIQIITVEKLFSLQVNDTKISLLFKPWRNMASKDWQKAGNASLASVTTSHLSFMMHAEAKMNVIRTNTLLPRLKADKIAQLLGKELTPPNILYLHLCYNKHWCICILYWKISRYMKARDMPLTDYYITISQKSAIQSDISIKKSFPVSSSVKVFKSVLQSIVVSPEHRA